MAEKITTAARYAYDATIGKVVCGVDEAGRGPLAGDVYAAAVILDLNKPQIPELNDSKKLTEKQRERLYNSIIEASLSYHIATATVEEIEKYNILEAAMLAMQRAVDGLKFTPEIVLVDGNRLPNLVYPAQCVVHGDALSASIAAASILAKIARDRAMRNLAEQYPEYGFDKHKGYGTRAHYAAIEQYGETPCHRHSFLKKFYASHDAE